MELLAPLGFGAANVVVAVPQAWIDVRYMSDLADVADGFRARHGRGLRVATKYINTTRRFFAAHDVSDYRIVESSGATEGAPAAGSADLIVDITTTGATLAANALKIIEDGVILRSQANLVASLTAPWDNAAREAARVILSRIAAEEEARTTRDVRASLPTLSEHILREAEANFGAGLRNMDDEFSDVLLSGEKGGGARRLADRPRRQKRHQRAARLYLSGGERLVEQAGGAAWVIRMSFPTLRSKRSDRESRVATTEFEVFLDSRSRASRVRRE